MALQNSCSSNLHIFFHIYFFKSRKWEIKPSMGQITRKACGAYSFIISGSIPYLFKLPNSMDTLHLRSVNNSNWTRKTNKGGKTNLDVVPAIPLGVHQQTSSVSVLAYDWMT